MPEADFQIRLKDEKELTFVNQSSVCICQKQANQAGSLIITWTEGEQKF